VAKRIVKSQQYVTSVCQHLKFCATCNQWSTLVRALQSSIKTACLLTWKKAKRVLQFEQNHSATLVQLWFRMNYGKEEPTRKSIYKWHKWLLKLIAFVLRRKIRTDDQVRRDFGG
jgi:hypothetical protein